MSFQILVCEWIKQTMLWSWFPRRIVCSEVFTHVEIQMLIYRFKQTRVFSSSRQDSTTVTPVTLTVDPKGYFLYWTDQSKVRHHGRKAKWFEAFKPLRCLKPLSLSFEFHLMMKFRFVGPNLKLITAAPTVSLISALTSAQCFVPAWHIIDRPMSISRVSSPKPEMYK